MARKVFFDAMHSQKITVDDRNADHGSKVFSGAVTGNMGHSQFTAKFGGNYCWGLARASTPQVLHAEGPLERVARVP